MFLYCEITKLKINTYETKINKKNLLVKFRKMPVLSQNERRKRVIGYTLYVMIGGWACTLLPKQIQIEVLVSMGSWDGAPTNGIA